MDFDLEFLKDKYGEAIGKWLCVEIEKMIEEVNDECVDNIRYRNIENEDSFEYEESVADGCCGFEDRIVTCPVNGNEFEIGCNYGY